MSCSEGELIPLEWLRFSKPFVPQARYFRPMDHMIYLNANLSYRSKWIDPTLDVLLDPYEDKVIGVKVSDFAAIVERELPDILGPGAILRGFWKSLGRLLWSKAMCIWRHI